MFLLSPARLDGARARLLFQPRTAFRLATALRSAAGAPIGEVFRFVSGLYFRGKLAYAERFARPPDDAPAIGVLVISQGYGLLPASTRIGLEHLQALARREVDHRARSFREPLARDARLVADAIGPSGEAVLLGSIATEKYVEPLVEALGARLLFPSDFVGRGDMSRGGLLLRAVDAGAELPYVPVLGAARHGARPPKLAPRRRATRPAE